MQINAEAERTRTEAALNNMKVLSEAVTVLQAAGFSPEGIRRLILRDSNLLSVLSGPIDTLSSYQEDHTITAIVQGDG
jgi:hypothetical protein